MEPNPSTTVLFAKPSNCAKRYEASRNAITSAVISVADSTGGRVVKTIGGKLMVLFTTPNTAASAASKMPAIVEALPALDGIRLGVHVGFHSEPVVRPGNGVSDDTVRLALRLLEQAQDGQTITSQQTAEQLDSAFREFSHLVREGAEQVRLCEITSWHQKDIRPPGWSAMALLRLTLRDQLAVCSWEKQVIVIGRDEDSDLVVDSKAGSRRHCTIEYCRGDFAVTDHSSNGTYITIASNTEIRVQADRLSLPEKGAIAIGEPRGDAPDVVEFSFALVT